MKSDINYYDTFIWVAGDCPADKGIVPQPKGQKKTVAVLQYEMIANHPYEFTQEDILFETFADYNEIPAEARPAERIKFFSRSQACLRASALPKRYGWGLHNNSEGKVALYAVDSEEYQRLARDPNLKQLAGMRSKRA
jgi:hypothetical protein